MDKNRGISANRRVFYAKGGKSFLARFKRINFLKKEKLKFSTKAILKIADKERSVGK